jgi:ribose 5-phosphate isomerase B
MKIAIGCDHAGFPLKEAVIAAVKKLGCEVIDTGTNGPASVDYPDFASKVARAVAHGDAGRGILICGSGIGVCIAANKFKGVRASIAHDLYSAEQGVMHDNMNVLCMGARVIPADLAPKLVEAFLKASFQSGEERHVRRCNKVAAIEKENFK